MKEHYDLLAAPLMAQLLGLGCLLNLNGGLALNFLKSGLGLEERLV